MSDEQIKKICGAVCFVALIVATAAMIITDHTDAAVFFGVLIFLV